MMTYLIVRSASSTATESTFQTDLCGFSCFCDFPLFDRWLLDWLPAVMPAELMLPARDVFPTESLWAFIPIILNSCREETTPVMSILKQIWHLFIYIFLNCSDLANNSHTQASKCCLIWSLVTSRLHHILTQHWYWHWCDSSIVWPETENCGCCTPQLT